MATFRHPKNIIIFLWKKPFCVHPKDETTKVRTAEHNVPFFALQNCVFFSKHTKASVFHLVAVFAAHSWCSNYSPFLCKISHYISSLKKRWLTAACGHERSFLRLLMVLEQLSVPLSQMQWCRDEGGLRRRRKKRTETFVGRSVRHQMFLFKLVVV